MQYARHFFFWCSDFSFMITPTLLVHAEMVAVEMVMDWCATVQSVGPWNPGFTQPTVTEQRTHFGLWCTMSSPLTLSLDFTNKTAVESVWPIITNTHAIDVNQAR